MAFDEEKELYNVLRFIPAPSTDSGGLGGPTAPAPQNFDTSDKPQSEQEARKLHQSTRLGGMRPVRIMCEYAEIPLEI